MKKHLDYIDSVKGIGMFLIIWGHISYLDDYVSIWASSFKVTMFFIISGLLVGMSSSDKNTYDSKKTTTKLIKSLMIPYCIYSLIAIMAHLLLSALQHKDLMRILLVDIYSTITLRGISTLWFLPALFLGRFVFEIIGMRKKSNLVHLLYVLILGSILYFARHIFTYLSCLDPVVNSMLSIPLLTILRGGMAFWFFEIGWLLMKLPKKFKNHIFAWYTALIMFVVNIFLSLINRNVDINNYKLGDYPVLFFICGIIGTISVVVGIKSIYNTFKVRLLEFIGKNSLFIMATHMPLYLTTIASKCVGMILKVQNHEPLYYLQCTMTVLVILIAEFIMISIMNWLNKLKRGKRE